MFHYTDILRILYINNVTDNSTAPTENEEKWERVDWNRRMKRTTIDESSERKQKKNMALANEGFRQSEQ